MLLLSKLMSAMKPTSVLVGLLVGCGAAGVGWLKGTQASCLAGRARSSLKFLHRQPVGR
jgi:hypothetical protein